VILMMMKTYPRIKKIVAGLDERADRDLIIANSTHPRNNVDFDVVSQRMLQLQRMPRAALSDFRPIGSRASRQTSRDFEHWRRRAIW